MFDAENSPGDDPQTRAEARTAYRHTIMRLEGRSVRWRMKVYQVTDAGECWLSPTRYPLPPRGPGHKGPRWFTLTTGLPSRDRVGFFSNCANFPTEPPKAPWLRSVKSTDPVILVGHIVEAHATPGGVLIALDAHVEPP